MEMQCIYFDSYIRRRILSSHSSSFNTSCRKKNKWATKLYRFVHITGNEYFSNISVPLLIQLFARQYQEDDWLQTADEIKTDLSLSKVAMYDFIVVGGGSAGCIVARRLQEHYKVLLIEAGGLPVPATDVPFFKIDVAFAPTINYRFPSVPQQHASLLSGGIIMHSAGKMLGGSSSHNSMIHNRGSPHDYDNYARILNDPTWSYTNVLEYFKQYENFIGRVVTGDHAENYGRNGPITVDTDESPFLPKWFQAGEELGFTIGDPNGYQQESFTPMAKTIRKGRRTNSFQEYIKPILNAKNSYLTVHQYSIATQILIDNNKKAYGVIYERHGIPQIALASKEVIISCGAYGSPLLLMKSGVGPREQLEAAGIPVRHESPHVGQNLQDHPYIVPTIFTFNSSALPYLPEFPKDDESILELLQIYETTGEGVLGQLLSGSQAFIVSSRANREGHPNWPNLQVFFNPMCHIRQYILPDFPTSCIIVSLGKPNSTGSILLNATAYMNGLTSNDEALAIVDFNFLEGAEAQKDVDVLLEGIQYALDIVNTKAFQSLGATLNGTPFPVCTQFEFMSEAFWRCYIEQTTSTLFHSVGTCSIGKVVDSKFRVESIYNLRVVDASVFPVIPNANTNAPVMMIAEKAVGNILEQWGQSKQYEYIQKY